MKALLTAVVVGVAIVLILTFAKNEEEVIIETAPELSPEEELEAAVQRMIEAAITASSTDIEAAKAEAAMEVENRLKAEIEERVRKEARNSV